MRSHRAEETAPAVNRPGPMTSSIAVAYAAAVSWSRSEAVRDTPSTRSGRAGSVGDPSDQKVSRTARVRDAALGRIRPMSTGPARYGSASSTSWSTRAPDDGTVQAASSPLLYDAELMSGARPAPR